jgi:hydrogenase expression/formation protein HypC
MPLSIPCKIAVIEQQGSVRVARVQLCGVNRQVNLDFVPDAQIGDYVTVHLGYAISLVDGKEVERAYQLSQSLDAFEEESSSSDVSEGNGS